MSAKSVQAKSWIQIRQDLYDHVRKHVDTLLGNSSEGLKRYEREYLQELEKKWKVVQRSDLLQRIEESRVVWLGDFHALQQSQKAQVRLLKSIQEPNKVVLGLECVEAKNQKILDKFIDSKISDREFLKAIQWKKTWGFPWDNYKPIFKWAQKNKVKILGLNLITGDRTAQSLRRRDVFSGQILADFCKKNQDKKIYVIYGDLHLASKHLPAELHKRVKNLKSMYIYQNPEKIYFELLKKDIEHQVDIVKISDNKFCLLSVPPWVKWQNYLMYLESHYDKAFDDNLDLTDHIAKYVKLIGQDLGLNVPIDNFSVLTAEDSLALQKLKKSLNREELDSVRFYLENGKSFFHPESGIAYLGSYSVNSSANLAMAIVMAFLCGQKKMIAEFPRQFPHLIWLESICYFGTKLVNPKRKTDTMLDIKASLSARNLDQGKEAMQLALSQKMLEMLHLSQGRRERELVRPRMRASYQEAARILGGILGEKLFFAYRKKLISKTTLLNLMRKPIESPQFANIYWEILEVVESFPEPFRSKKDKI